MSKLKLKFAVGPSEVPAGLLFTARLNGESFFSRTITETHHCEHEFEDADNGHYVLEFELSNKLPEHTRVDEAGTIVSDSVIEIKNIEIEEINIEKVIHEKSIYSHDFNGTQSLQTHKFYGIMGCNGTVKFEFDTPFYLWLLENI